MLVCMYINIVCYMYSDRIYCFTYDAFLLVLVPVIKNTIGQYTSRIVYYSETVDTSIPTEDTGVPNMESGKTKRNRSNPKRLCRQMFLFLAHTLV